MSVSSIDLGACAIFLYSSQLNSSAVDAVYLGQIPTTTGTMSTGTWTRVYQSAESGATLNCDGPTVDLMTLEEGLKQVCITNPDKWTLDIPVADLSSGTFKKLLQLNPNFYSSSNSYMPLNSNLTGFNLLANGLPMLIVHKKYQNLSTGSVDTPVLTDPNSFFFCWAGVGERKIAVNYDPAKQQIIDVKMTMINCTGTSLSNIMGAFGQLTASI